MDEKKGPSERVPALQRASMSFTREELAGLHAVLCAVRDQRYGTAFMRMRDESVRRFANKVTGMVARIEAKEREQVKHEQDARSAERRQPDCADGSGAQRAGLSAGDVG